MRLVPRQLKWLGFGALVGWLFDPERGSERRKQLSEQWSRLTDGADRQVHQDRGIRVGADHEMQAS